VSNFGTVKEAKDYLANRIAAEAAREGVPLSEVERKMLYFSETDWTLPDMEKANAEFDRDYNQDDYEQKIAGLIANVVADHHHRNKGEEEKWDAAVDKLSESDHYLTVLLSATRTSKPGLNGFLPTLGSGSVRPAHDLLKLCIAAFAVVVGIFGAMAIGRWLLGPRFWTVADWVFDRNHRGMILLIPFAVWFLWQVRRDVKSFADGLLKRPQSRGRSTQR